MRFEFCFEENVTEPGTGILVCLHQYEGYAVIESDHSAGERGWSVDSIHLHGHRRGKNPSKWGAYACHLPTTYPLEQKIRSWLHSTVMRSEIDEKWGDYVAECRHEKVEV